MIWDGKIMTSETSEIGLDGTRAAGDATLASTRYLECFFCDRLGQLRRPVLLLSIVCGDLAAIALAGLSAYVMVPGGGIGGVTAATMIASVAVMIVAMLSANWSYSVAALRQPAAQIIKALRVIALMALAASGVLYLAGVTMVPAGLILSWSALALVALGAIRLVAARLITVFAEAGRLRRRTVI